jgi:hypothetical protein
VLAQPSKESLASLQKEVDLLQAQQLTLTNTIYKYGLDGSTIRVKTLDGRGLSLSIDYVVSGLTAVLSSVIDTLGAANQSINYQYLRENGLLAFLNRPGMAVGEELLARVKLKLEVGMVNSVLLAMKLLLAVLLATVMVPLFFRIEAISQGMVNLFTIIPQGELLELVEQLMTFQKVPSELGIAKSKYMDLSIKFDPHTEVDESAHQLHSGTARRTMRSKAKTIEFHQFVLPRLSLTMLLVGAVAFLGTLSFFIADNLSLENMVANQRDLLEDFARLTNRSQLMASMRAASGDALYYPPGSN